LPLPGAESSRLSLTFLLLIPTPDHKNFQPFTYRK
jgi:hypothetical protein